MQSIKIFWVYLLKSIWFNWAKFHHRQVSQFRTIITQLLAPKLGNPHPAHSFVCISSNSSIQIRTIATIFSSFSHLTVLYCFFVAYFFFLLLFFLEKQMSRMLLRVQCASIIKFSQKQAAQIMLRVCIGAHSQSLSRQEKVKICVVVQTLGK